MNGDVPRFCVMRRRGLRRSAQGDRQAQRQSRGQNRAHPVSFRRRPSGAPPKRAGVIHPSPCVFVAPAGNREAWAAGRSVHTLAGINGAMWTRTQPMRAGCIGGSATAGRQTQNQNSRQHRAHSVRFHRRRLTAHAHQRTRVIQPALRTSVTPAGHREACGAGRRARGGHLPGTSGDMRARALPMRGSRVGRRAGSDQRTEHQNRGQDRGQGRG